MIDILSEKFPDSQIDFLINKRVEELLLNYPNINKVQSIEKDRLKDIYQVCKKEKYDLAVIVRPTFIIAMALFLGRIKYRLGTGFRWYSFLFNIRHYQHRKHSIKHELEYNLDLLFELGINVDYNHLPKLDVKSETINAVKAKLIQMGVDFNKDFIIIHTTTLSSAQVWNNDNFIKLINLLINDSDCDFNILLTGTISERKSIYSIFEKIIHNDEVYPILDFNLTELAALIKLSRLFISNSTGPIHIAAAVGTFVAGFYSPLISESAARWAPYTNRKKIFTPLNIHDVKNRSSKGLNLMEQIKPEDVYSFVRNFMLNQAK